MGSIAHLCFFLFSKLFIKSFFSSVLFFVCLVVLYHSKTNHVADVTEAKIKIYYHNVNSSNSSLEGLADNILKSKADIICLVEVSPDIDIFLRKKLSNYSHTYSIPRNDNFGFSIFSKHKFNMHYVHEAQGIPVYVKLYFESINIKFYLIHLPPPLWKEAWVTQEETLSLITNEINKNRMLPFLVVGDMNMTPSSSIFLDFYKKLQPKYDSGKNFFLGTWPSFLPKYFSLPIDHVFSDERFDIEQGSSAGSDHRSFIIRM